MKDVSVTIFQTYMFIIVIKLITKLTFGEMILGKVLLIKVAFGEMTLGEADPNQKGHVWCSNTYFLLFFFCELSEYENEKCDEIKLKRE